jgi:hypothetical protein
VVHKKYCSSCKKELDKVIRSFETVAYWDKKEEFYQPGRGGKFVDRCPDCKMIVNGERPHVERREGREEGQSKAF